MIKRCKPTLIECKNAVRGARKRGRLTVACVRKAQARVPPLASDGHHVLVLHCFIYSCDERVYTAPKKKSAHPALSANEEVRIGASGSAGEGTRLESAESLERTFEGPGCGGRTAPLSLALDSQRFLRCSSVPLPFGLWGDTTGVSLRFSKLDAMSFSLMFMIGE